MLGERYSWTLEIEKVFPRLTCVMRLDVLELSVALPARIDKDWML